MNVTLNCQGLIITSLPGLSSIKTTWLLTAANSTWIVAMFRTVRSTSKDQCSSFLSAAKRTAPYLRSSGHFVNVGSMVTDHLATSKTWAKHESTVESGHISDMRSRKSWKSSSLSSRQDFKIWSVNPKLVLRWNF